MAKLSYLIPCYYNADSLVPLFEKIKDSQKLFPESLSFEYIFVDDGSGDETWETLTRIQKEYENENIKLVKLIKNYGSHIALYAGMHYAEGDCHVILAADLQDPPDLIPQLFDSWSKGYRLALAHRTDRQESKARKIVANTFHQLFKKFAVSNVPDGGFDLMLFDKKLTQEVLKFHESGLHIPYALFSLGYPFTTYPYVRLKREYGTSRWTLGKKIRLFIDAFVGYSYAPIRLISILGFIMALLCLFYTMIVLGNYFIGGSKVEGWSSLMIVVLIVSSFQFISLGVLGEYLWRVLDTVRERPKFIVDKYVK